MASLWSKIRRVWAITGATAFVVFAGWSLIAFMPSADARAALRGDDRVSVERGAAWWLFTANGPAADTGLLFYPGGLVDPVAYAPLARDVARAGYRVLLVELPRRGAFGGADSPEVFARARDAMRSVPAVRHWIVAGHSLGGAVASRMAHSDRAGLAGLVLIGTSHPRDFSLADTQLAVTRVYGTRDTVADVDKQERTRANLPPSARIVQIDGGNHSQFGSYGFQPGDWPATISRAEQQRLTVEAIVAALAAASSLKATVDDRSPKP